MSASFRLWPLFKRHPEEAAACEQRPQTNMLEKLVRNYCRAHSIAGLTEEPTREDDPGERKHVHEGTKR